MLQLLKKKGKLIIIIVVALIIIAGGLLGYMQYTKVKNQIAIKDQEIMQLQQTITNIGDLVTAYVVRADVVAGKPVEETDLQPVDIPLSMAGTMVTNINDTKGKFYKIGLKQGSTLTVDMLLDSKLEDSTRLFDVVTDENPLGLRPGSYVDVRISMPLGEDFVAMTHKRVHSINSGILKLAVTEQDIHVYNSMLVDKILYPGTRIYAVEYAEPGAQKAATSYYPVSKNVLAILEKDPNLVEAVKQDMVARRDQLEASLNSAINPEIARVLQQGKQTITQAIDESDREIQQRWEEEERERKRLEEQNRVLQQQQSNGVVN